MPPKEVKRYQKKDPISHCLERPDMYVGSTRPRNMEEYIAEYKDNEYNYHIVKKEIQSSPAILRIFIEALSNAIDNVERSKKTNTPCTTIKVSINKETGETSIFNDGDVVPIEMHEDEKVYNHTMIFGQLLTGSNYDDEEERIVAGRNGIGGKAVNIFSSKFTVSGCDPERMKTFTQTWTNNMRDVGEPIISKCKAKDKGYTQITWIPDFKQFDLKNYTDDIIALYTKNVLDAAMLSKVKVYFNDVLINIKNLSQYSQLYDAPTEDKLYIKTDTCEVVLTPSSTGYEYISFVNGIYTRMGGQHVESWSEAIFRPIVEKFNVKNKNNKTLKINIADVKQFFRIFVVATVIRPEFNGQNKDKLESPTVPATIKSTHINAINKWSVMDSIEDIIRSKEMMVLKKAERGKKKNVKVEGLDPANNAGGKYSSECCLFICEGLSAKTYVVAGINTGVYGKQGRDWHGILPVTGKVLNTRNAAPTSIAANKVVMSFIQTTGLRYDVDYTNEDNFKTLSYGKVILIADADCFTKDTPLLIKKDGNIDVISCETLYKSDNKNIEIWSANGWTKMKGIICKETDKKILQINTGCGLIKCTEDHKMMLENGEEIKACELKIGDRLLRTQGSLRHPLEHITNTYINTQEAFAWGLFFAEGSCEEHIMEKYYNHYQLNLNGDKSISEFITTMQERFYDVNNRAHKKVPKEILNSDLDVQQSFLDGFRSLKNAMGFDILGQLGAQGLCVILERLGYCVNVNHNKRDIYTIHYSNTLYPSAIKSIKTIDYDDYVYDIETENHLLNAGIGGLVVHNCDGIHIEGLLMNLIHSLFPSLLNRKETYISSMKTPIARVFIPKSKDLLFYDETRFNKYISEQTKKVNAKYYKGLGTTREEDVPDTFGLKMVEYINDKDVLVNMNKVFHKKHSDDRKKWLEEYNPLNKTFSLDDQPNSCNMNISNFLNDEMIKFSHADCARSIPNGIDGMKESQRKILYAVRKRNLKYFGTSLKVAQLSGYTAEHSNYHHGEQNLQDTIVNMASGFVGTNNIPLLYPDGSFGSRLDGGDDAASARYIFTKMEGMTEYIFRVEDDPLLTPVNDDGDLVQPEHYIPIIPMILVNGCTAGIGTGWSCNVPCYNPKDLIECIKVWIENDGEVLIEDPDTGSIVSMFSPITPWYRGFKGVIKADGPNRFVTEGVITQGKKDTKEVTELPIGLWTNKFKEFCEDLVCDKKVKSMKNYSSTRDVSFILSESADGFSCNIENMKLQTYVYTSNMVLFTEKNQLRKYYNVDQIIDNFCKVRLDYYVKRKKYQVNNLENEIRHLGNKERFIQEVIDKEIMIMNEKEEDIVENLKDSGYDEEPDAGGYDYLLRLQVRTFTSDKVKQLKNDITSSKTKLDVLIKTKPEQMWMNELNELEKHYEKWLVEMAKRVPKKKEGKK